MSVQGGFHSYEGKPYSERSFEKALALGYLSLEDRDIILTYLDEKLVVSRITEVRSLKLATTLVGWKRNGLITKPYRELTYPDLLLSVRKLETAPNRKNRPFSENTKHDYVVILKPFLHWLIENGFNTVLTSEQVRKIKNPKANRDTRHPSDILTPDEIVAMITGATNSRDRAILAMHYECGTRISEIARLKWMDIESDKYGAIVYITDNKTKKRRQGRITTNFAATYLNIWKNDYPGDPSGSNPVFVKLQRGDGPITYGLVYQMFHDAAQAAGITI
jgi:site-specific recombinase XerD